MKKILCFTLGVLLSIPLVGRLLQFVLEPDYIQAKRDAEFAVRCDGDLIVSEIKGHKVEMIRWLK